MIAQRLGSALFAGVLALSACAEAPPIGGGPGAPTPPEPSPALVDVAWSEAPGQPIARTEALGAVVDDVLYVFGGYTAFTPVFCTSRGVHAFDPADGTWSTRSDLPQAWTHAGVAVDGPYVYLAAGREPLPGGDAPDCAPVDVGTDEVWRYDTVADAWTALPALPATRSSGTLAVIGRSLHFVGGVADVPSAPEGFEESAAHWALDLDAPTTWTPRAPIPIARSHLGAVVRDGSLYVLGGQVGEQSALVTQAHVHRYDAETDTWSERAPLPASVGHVTGTTLEIEGQIVVLGGERAHNEPVPDAYAYDPAADAWSVLPPLPEPMRAAVAGWIDGSLWLLDADFSTSAWQGSPTFEVP